MSPRDPGILQGQTKIKEEIDSLLPKGAIVKVDDHPSVSLSSFFVSPAPPPKKKSGGLRVILNLKHINVFIPPQHFRMEFLSTVLSQLCKDDWAVTLDLQDAYLHVLMHPSSRHLLDFLYRNQVYEYKVLPFGLKDPQWVFTRIVAVVPPSSRHLHFLLPRRLAPSGKFQSSLGGPSPDHSAPYSRSGVSGELGQVTRPLPLLNSRLT